MPVIETFHNPLGRKMASDYRSAASAELDADTERALSIAWVDHGDFAALNKLAMAYLPMAVHTVFNRFRSAPIDARELIGAATEGLYIAASRFDARTSPNRFGRFASHYIGDALKKTIDLHVRPVKLHGSKIFDRHQKVGWAKATCPQTGQESREELAALLAKHINDSPLGQKLAEKFTQQQILNVLNHAMTERLLYIDKTFTDDWGAPRYGFADKYPAPELDGERILVEREKRAVRAAGVREVGALLKDLRPRDQYIFMARYAFEKSFAFQDVALAFGISGEAVRQSCKSIIGRLSKQLSATFNGAMEPSTIRDSIEAAAPPFQKVKGVPPHLQNDVNGPVAKLAALVTMLP